MRFVINAVLILASLVAGSRVASGQTALSVEGLRCEYLSNPLGIDVEKPRLSWTMAPGPRGRGQSVYQVLVASSLENLRQDKGDLWDSGRIRSDQTAFVAYSGRPLGAGAQAWWKVRVWDQAGQVTPWSAPAHWSMGVLRDSEWYGRWIGLARAADVKEGTPLPCPWLRKTFTLAKKPQRATAYVNALGYYELYVNGKKVDDYVPVSYTHLDVYKRQVSRRSSAAGAFPICGWAQPSGPTWSPSAGRTSRPPPRRNHPA